MQGAQDQSASVLFTDVVKAFKAFPAGRTVRALGGVSFEVLPGRIVGLVGPNGSGKTTAFRIAAGLLKPTGGSVKVLDHRPGSMQARFMTGYMPEQPGIPETLTPREMLDFIGRIYGMAPARRKARIKELQDLLALSDYMDRRIGRLSKGMYKRVGLATALFHIPRVLLLDEPLEGLDPLGSGEVKEHLKSLAQEGVAILISSHILSDVEAICSRIIIVHEGKILLRGDRDSILALRDRMTVRFKAPEGGALLEEITGLIKERGGEVEFAGHPREGLEALFKRIVGEVPSSERKAEP